MSKNENLHKAKTQKNDEFYTQYEDIQLELNHYEKHFEGKTVLCNCDDPFESNFCKFFLRNFNYLKLKRLICTSYSTSPIAGTQLSLFDYAEGKEIEGHGFVLDITNIPMRNGRGVSDDDIDDLLRSEYHGVQRLDGNGDFRSEECIEYLKQADIVCTNCPFSLFREYVATLVKYDKKYLIIGPKNAITYKEFFPLIKDNKVWIGYNSVKSFVQPNGEMKTFGNVGWYTNLDIPKRHEDLILYEHYYGNESEYPKYDNYDAINVDKVAKIPVDYVPCWFNCAEAENCMWAQKTGMDTNAEATCEIEIKSYEKSRKTLTSSESDRTILSGQVRSGQVRSGQVRSGQNDYCVRCNGIIGVPITYLDKHNPEQFEIITMSTMSGKSANYWSFINGKSKYSRVFIRRKKV